MTDIDKLETLRVAATQGPFEHVTPPPGYSFGFIGYYVEHEGKQLRGEFPAKDADDAYTVALLNAAPALFAEIRRLRAIEEAAWEMDNDLSLSLEMQASSDVYELWKSALAETKRRKAALAAKENGK